MMNQMCAPYCAVVDATAAAVEEPSVAERANAEGKTAVGVA